MIFTVTLLTSCLKLLLIPAYRSTDFEVHRNWLAITHNLPIKQWYFENTSEWTLDYPPLFAYFEYFLSFIAYLFDKNMLVVDHLYYASERTVLFQRLSVIFTDFLYAFGVYRCCCALHKSWRTDVVLPIILVTNCGLLMIDHIHFQYNGFLYGVMLLSISYMLRDKYFLSAFWFCILLNLKHIYIYLAPAYFVYLLRHCCIRGAINFKNISSKTCFKNLLGLASIVVAVFLVAFMPFYDHIGQVLSRMFPFKRGLCHAYWAPNFWAVYNVADKCLHFMVVKCGLIGLNSNNTASMTGGLVQEFSHLILPNIHPVATIVLTAIMMIPALIKLFISTSKNPSNFLRTIVLSALTSFIFGWHVHEKAILMTIIPLSVLAVIESGDARIFLLLSTVGHYSLFPLLYPSNLLLIKVLLLTLHSAYAFHSLSKIYPLAVCKYSFPMLSVPESLLVLGLVPLFFYENVIHKLCGFDNRWPFLPLMMTSVYCSIGVIYCWIKYYCYFLKSVKTNNNNNSAKVKNKAH